MALSVTIIYVSEANQLKKKHLPESLLLSLLWTMAKATTGYCEDLHGAPIQTDASDRPGDSCGGGPLPLTISLSFTLKSSGKENGNKNEVKGSKLEIVRHLKSGRTG